MIHSCLVCVCVTKLRGTELCDKGTRVFVCVRVCERVVCDKGVCVCVRVKTLCMKELHVCVCDSVCVCV